MEILKSLTTEQIAQEVIKNNKAIQQLSEVNDLLFQELSERNILDKPEQLELF
jgi:hypothetical protein